MASDNFPDIFLVAERIGLKFKKNVLGGTRDYVCPLCDDKTGHLNINGTEKVWRCNRCNEGGGVIALVETMCGLSREDAKRFLRDLNSANVVYINDRDVVTKEEKIKQCKLAAPEVRDHTYRTLLSLLLLNKEHRDNLRTRGLSDKAINKLQYKSTPGKYNSKIPLELIKRGCVVEGVPGFFKKDGRWTMFCCSTGYFVPFVDLNGFISSMQIRSDEPGVKNRYRAFSTNGFYYGTKASTDIHIVGYNDQDFIVLTEGALKADVATYLMHKIYKRKVPFMAIAGVSNTANLGKTLKKLKELGVKTIIEALDMDKKGNSSVELNPNVAKAPEKIKTMIEKEGLEYKQFTWNKCKGIDDYLFYKLAKREKREDKHAI